MPNSNSPASKKARSKSSDARKARVVAAGGLRKNVLLTSEGHAAMLELSKRTGNSGTRVINDALIEQAKIISLGS